MHPVQQFQEDIDFLLREIEEQEFLAFKRYLNDPIVKFEPCGR